MVKWAQQTGDVTGATLIDLDTVTNIKIGDKTETTYQDDDSDLSTPDIPVSVPKALIIFEKLNPNQNRPRVWEFITPATGVKEIQDISDATPAENDVYALTFGALTVTTAALGATPDTAALVAAILAATDYADLPFVVTEGTDEIVCTWKVIGAIDVLASMVKTVGSGTPATTENTAGVDNTVEAAAAISLASIITLISATVIS